MTQEALFAYTRADGTRGLLRTVKNHGLEQLRAHLHPGYTVQVLPGADLVTLSADTNVEQFKNLLAGVGSGYRVATYDDFGRSDTALGALPNPVLQALGAKGLAPRRCLLYLSAKGDTPEPAPFLIDDTLDHFGVHRPPPALLSPLTPTAVRTRLFNDWRATISPIYLLPAQRVLLRGASCSSRWPPPTSSRGGSTSPTIRPRPSSKPSRTWKRCRTTARACRPRRQRPCGCSSCFINDNAAPEGAAFLLGPGFRRWR